MRTNAYHSPADKSAGYEQRRINAAKESPIYRAPLTAQRLHRRAKPPLAAAPVTTSAALLAAKKRARDKKD
jgi:hypothetical protein